MPTRKRIHRRIYPLRASNMAAGGLVVTASLAEQVPDMALWAFALISALAWPHIAYLHASKKKDSYRAEQVNGLIDGFIVGCWIPLMQFSLLPSICIVAISVADRFYTGLRKRWLKTGCMTLIGIAFMSAYASVEPHWNASLLVQFSLLPMILVHSVFASWSSRRMVKALAKQNVQLQVLGRIDPLTTVYSREYWWQKARTALRQHHSGTEINSLLIIDIDHFKQVNDTYGHTVGDEVLQSIGLTIRHCLRSNDIAGRYGGDEFAVLCRNTRTEDACTVALRVRDHLATIRVREHPQLRISASIGVAEASAEFTSVKQWIEAADAALYDAKAAGRDRINAEAPRRNSPATIPMPAESTALPTHDVVPYAEKKEARDDDEVQQPSRISD